MNARERYLETLLFGKPDKIPFSPGWPRESTLRVWHAQGLPEDVSWYAYLLEHLGIEMEPTKPHVALGVDFKMIPQFEEKVLEHRDGHYIVQDWMGAITEISDEYDYTYIRSAKDFVTRKWHRFPVISRQDWEERMKWRYDPTAAGRFPADFAALCEALRDRDYPLIVSFNGPFWQMREWVGMEGLCALTIDDPQFVADMAEFWRTYVMAVLEQILRRVRMDVLYVSEDMAYKAHSMISPAMTRRFLQPAYVSWIDLLKSYGDGFLDMDSDGYIAHLIPIWIESGIKACNPIEVAAGNDLNEFRRQFGHRMAYHGGIDKRCIAAGGDVMRDEVMRLVPVLRDGGFIPSCDHGVPPDISWPTFIEYTRLLAELQGWV